MECASPENEWEFIRVVAENLQTPNGERKVLRKDSN